MKKKGMEIREYNTYEKVKISDTANEKLVAMYHGMLKDIFDKDVDIERLREVSYDVAKYLKLLRPTTKLKYYAYALLEKIAFKNKHFVTSLMLYNDNIPHGKEILNLDHKEYFNVFDETDRRVSSFDDCYNSGIKHFIKMTNDLGNKEFYKYI